MESNAVSTQNIIVVSQNNTIFHKTSVAIADLCIFTLKES